MNNSHLYDPYTQTTAFRNKEWKITLLDVVREVLYHIATGSLVWIKTHNHNKRLKEA